MALRHGVGHTQFEGRRALRRLALLTVVIVAFAGWTVAEGFAATQTVRITGVCASQGDGINTFTSYRVTWGYKTEDGGGSVYFIALDSNGLTVGSQYGAATILYPNTSAQGFVTVVYAGPDSPVSAVASIVGGDGSFSQPKNGWKLCK
jgi:hypothetical protein